VLVRISIVPRGAALLFPDQAWHQPSRASSERLWRAAVCEYELQGPVHKNKYTPDTWKALFVTTAMSVRLSARNNDSPSSEQDVASSQHVSTTRLTLSRPHRKSVTAETELSFADSATSLMKDEEVDPINAVKGIQAFYTSNKKHIWFTISTICVFIAAFIIFERLYPQSKANNEKNTTVPSECLAPPDERGCYDFEKCILPGFDAEQYPKLTMPSCSDTKNPCGYQCTCEETKPSQLTEKDFAVSIFLFFTPKVPYVQAGLGGAFLTFLMATLLLRQKHQVKDHRYAFIP
jgi:hypothetical protein